MKGYLWGEIWGIKRRILGLRIASPGYNAHFSMMDGMMRETVR